MSKQKVYNTRTSQVVTHPSTTQAQRCLTLEIRRDPVTSPWYGRRQEWCLNESIMLLKFKEKRRKESTTPGLPKWSPTLVLPRRDDV